MVLNALEPEWEARFEASSYGFRPGRGCKDALREVDQLLKAGYTFVVDADLKSYFDQASWYSCQEPSTRYDGSNRYWGE